MDTEHQPRLDNQIKCPCNVFEEIDSFRSIIEYQRFRKYLDEFVQSNDIEEIRIESASQFYDEKLYKCKQCNQR
ncbi:hypothetical protein VN24_03510 [Paenibacillus beijingensis]|uniref:Uncharacterized protein n=1 Tax=Paenibacillus beijingensis TaxID=1126833 RepID=A0A0D5NFC6_9BACL|nr:hypothetical protein VN24_03510 [Paenibacillus beijingensis]